jgi:hypothetical protein
MGAWNYDRSVHYVGLGSVPEPATMVLFSIGLLFVIGLRRSLQTTRRSPGHIASELMSALD